MVLKISEFGIQLTYQNEFEDWSFHELGYDGWTYPFRFNVEDEKKK